MSETIRHLHAHLERRLDKRVAFETLDRLYVEIRDRQFAENLDTLCENDFEARLHEMIEAVHDAPNADLLRESLLAYAAGFVNALRLQDGMYDTVARLSAQFDGRVVVCSNFILADPIREILRRDSLLPHLMDVIVSCEIGFIKPHPLIFEVTAMALGLEPSEIVHIGDNLEADVIGGRKAGMTTVFTSEFRDPVDQGELAMAAPDFTVARLSDLVRE
jgi:HAD superfamily hydrolase (TIGR01509 family)